MSQIPNDYPTQKGLSLPQWLETWAAMEQARIAKVQANFQAWLLTQDTSLWVVRTMEQWARILAPADNLKAVIQKNEEGQHAETGR